MTTVTLTLGSRAITARIDAGHTVHIDDAAFSILEIEAGLYLVDDGARRWQVAVATSGDERWVSVDGRVAVLEVEVPTRRGARKRSGGGHAMMAPMPATVVKVLAEPGQQVSEGEVVLVLEAMKMELPIRAARSGVIQAINCTHGELVQPGVALVELT